MALGNPLPLLLSTVGKYEIERSCRFNSAETAVKLTRTFSGGTTTKYTLSVWIKRTKFGATTPICGYYSGDTNSQNPFRFNSSDQLEWYNYTGGYQGRLVTNRVFRDPSAFYHLVFVWDTGNSTAGDRMKIYVNGIEETSFATDSNPSQDQASHWNGNNEMTIGTTTNYNDGWFDGYMAEMHFIDNAVKTAADFGETDEDTGQWIPKKYTGAHGTTGFYLSFADNSSTANMFVDDSANSNNWSHHNMSNAAGVGNDSVTDTPTNNYPTLNPFNGLGSGFYASLNGALDYNITDTAYIGLSTMAVPTSGKWYAECTATDVESLGFGLRPSDWHGGLFVKGYLYLYYGKTWKDNAEQETVTAISDGDIVGCAVDRTAGTVQFSLNGTNKGSTLALVADEEYYFWVSRGASSGGAPIGSVNFGQRAFSHQPSGFVGLCTSELPTPTIKKSTDYFNTVLYTGNGGSSQTITGLDFSPDFVWFKERSGTQNHMVFDTVRGVEQSLWPNDTWTEEAYSGEGVSAFNSNGVTIGNSGNLNVNSDTYVMWALKESATAGFDIVSYTGTGSNPQTRAHSLGVAPEMIILKSRSGTDGDEHWAIYHHKNQSTDANSKNYWARLNTADAFEDLEMWNDTAPTSSIFTTQNHAISNANTKTFIAYLFASVKGFSKVGSFLGNGNANGPFVYTGFRPAWILVKNAARSAHWGIYDVKRDQNPNTNVLQPNLNDAEDASGHGFDLLSNGFKIRSSGSPYNHSGETMIFLAFAETPFKYANAR